MIELIEDIEASVNAAAELCHQRAKDNGWWNDREWIIKAARARRGPKLEDAARANIDIACLGLICSEAGEAMDSVRNGCPPDDKLPEYPGDAVEVADIIIRALDYAGRKGYPIGTIIRKKLKKNVERGQMRGGKLA